MSRNDTRAARGWHAISLHPDYESMESDTCASDIVADILHALSRGPEPVVEAHNLQSFLDTAMRIYEGDQEDEAEQVDPQTVFVVTSLNGDVEVLDRQPEWDWAARGQTVRAASVNGGDSAIIAPPSTQTITVVLDVAGAEDPVAYVTGAIDVGDGEGRFTNVEIHPEDLTSGGA